MTANPITKEQAQTVRLWRNDCRQALRTGWTIEIQQDRFVEGNMTGSYMYWWFNKEREQIEAPIVDRPTVSAMRLRMNAAGGLVNIDRRVRNAEIALICHPADRGEGLGKACAEWILNESFRTQNMKTVYGEVYNCGAVAFWLGICEKYNAYTTELPNRQYWKGEYFDSMYFSIDRSKYENV
jgi:RimJ/RimL family protein N-acetyltransferase